jgi:hypothetical protein
LSALTDEPPEKDNWDSGEVLYEFGEGGEEGEDEWMKVEAAVDSAAVAHVMKNGTVPQIKKKPSQGSESGKFWWSASNQKIFNEGEKTISFQTGCKKKRRMVFQIANVGRTLISVDRLSESGHTVILNKENPRIKCPNGDIIKLRKRNKMFIMDIWIKRSPLEGQ